jgi:ribosomal protein L7/L12
MVTPADPLPARVLAALRLGNSVEAIKLLRESTGLGLKEAKDAIDRHHRAARPKSFEDSTPATSLPAAVVDALRQGQKIEAIRLLREQTGLGLAQAKHAVETFHVGPGTVTGGLAPGEEPKSRSAAWGIALLVVVVLLVYMFATGRAVRAAGAGQTKFQDVPTQFIAALGDPGATSGSNAQSWGLWPLDPGPRGVGLSDYKRLKDAGGVAPARWKLDGADWWLEEHGLIMEKPDFPVPPRKYRVTGGRSVTAVLTIHPLDRNGDQRWELDGGATLYDVTHLDCRSARYQPTDNGSCSPANAGQAAFPVAPGAAMPAVEGCNKQDYSVLIVVGVGAQD